MAMFKEPELYMSCSNDHVREAKKNLQKFGNLIKFQPREDIMDIGCGTGDVTYNAILPILHPEYSKLVGVDISEDMINFSKSRWPHETRLQFVVTDAAEQDLSKLYDSLPVQKYDKIFSFFALQWVNDRSRLARNISSLLKPGGQAYVVLVVDSGVYKVWDSLVKSDKWSTFFQNVKTPLNEYMYMDDPAVEFKRQLETFGLKVIACQLQFHKNAFSSNIESDSDKIKKLRSVDPLVSLLPEYLKNDYMSDVLKYTKKMVGPNGAVDYKSLTVICQKS